MNPDMQLIERIVGAFDESDEFRQQNHDDAVQCVNIELRIKLLPRLIELLDNSVAKFIRLARDRRAEDSDYPNLQVFAKDVILILERVCKFEKSSEEAIASLRKKGFDVDGAEQFMGCIRDAENRIKKWRDEQGRAMKMRAEWMRAQGLPDEEIAEYCDPGKYPGDLREEEDNLRATETLGQMPLANDLWAKHATSLQS